MNDLEEELRSLASPEPPDPAALFSAVRDTSRRRLPGHRAFAAVLVVLALTAALARPTQRTRAWDEGLASRAQQLAKAWLSSQETPR